MPEGRHAGLNVRRDTSLTLACSGDRDAVAYSTMRHGINSIKLHISRISDCIREIILLFLVKDRKRGI